MADPTDRAPLGKTGLAVSRLGVGGTPFGNLFRQLEEEDLAAGFEMAWERGLRYFDTAPQYGGGLSERRLGKLLARKPRNSFVLSSKVGKLLVPATGGRAPDGIFAHGLPYEVQYDYSYDGTMRSIEESLGRLGLDRLDVVFIHDVNRKYHGDQVGDVYHVARDGACRALARLRGEGVIAGFGPANRELDINLRFLDEVDIDCLMLPSRFTLLDRSAGDELLPRCHDKKVGVLLAGPFDSGILATGPVAGAMYAYAPADDNTIGRVRSMQQICNEAGVPLAAAALQYPLRHPAIASVVTGMSSASEVEANLRLMTVEIPDRLWPAISTV